jgi:hypothetical protein
MNGGNKCPVTPDFMYYADTIHDMFKGRGNNTDNVRPQLNKIMHSDVTAYVKKESKGDVTSPSDIEQQTEKHIEKTCDLPVDAFEFTYNEVMNDSNDQTLLQEVQDAYNLQDVMIISGIDDEKTNLVKNTPERNYIARFILNFFIPGYKNQDVGFVFDAGTGKLPYIFNNIEQCETCKTALTIADSAGTSLDDPSNTSSKKKSEKSLSKLNRWTALFPLDTNRNCEYNITSNHFTKDILRLKYTSPGNLFCKNNMFAINFVAESKRGTATVDFNSTNNQGASVNQLKDIVINISDMSKVPDATNTLNIKEVVNQLLSQGFSYEELIKFLFDYKRAGDYEQVNSMDIIKQNYNLSIFSSIDVLCILYARLKRINCIRTHAGNLYLYRFAGEATVVSNDILFKKKIIDLKNKCKQLLKIFEIGQSSKEELFPTNYNIQVNHFDQAILYSNENKTLPIPFINKLLLLNIVDLKNKFMSIFADGSYLKIIFEKVENTSKSYGTDIDGMIIFLTNFIKQDENYWTEHKESVNITPSTPATVTIFYIMLYENGQQLINMNELITYFELDNRNIYKELINTVDELYNENQKKFILTPRELVKSHNGALIENRNIPFPFFTTKDYSYMYKSIELIKIELKRRRGNQNIIKLNIGILLDEINIIVDNMQTLNPQWVDLKEQIFIDVDFNTVDFESNLTKLDANIGAILAPTVKGGGLDYGKRFGGAGEGRNKKRAISPTADQISTRGRMREQLADNRGITIVTAPPSFYFELNEIFNSVTQPLRASIDSIYSTNYKGENIYNLLKNLQEKMNSINIQIEATTFVLVIDTIKLQVLNQNRENAWNRNISSINNLISNLRIEPQGDYDRILIDHINKLLEPGNVFGSYEESHQALDEIVHTRAPRDRETSNLEDVSKVISNRITLLRSIGFSYLNQMKSLVQSNLAAPMEQVLNEIKSQHPVLLESIHKNYDAFVAMIRGYIDVDETLVTHIGVEKWGKMKRRIQSNIAASLEQVLNEIESKHPELLESIHKNYDAFVAMISGSIPIMSDEPLVTQIAEVKWREMHGLVQSNLAAPMEQVLNEIKSQHPVLLESIHKNYDAFVAMIRGYIDVDETLVTHIGVEKWGKMKRRIQSNIAASLEQVLNEIESKHPELLESIHKNYDTFVAMMLNPIDLTMTMTMNDLANKIHYLYALWVTEYERLLLLYNITENNVPSSVDLIGFILALKTTQNAEGNFVVGIDDRYKEKFSIIIEYQNTAKVKNRVRRDDINNYNDIFTYYAYNLNDNGIYPEVTTAIIFAYLDYKTNSDILLFKFPRQVNDLLPNNQLLSKNDWDTFYEKIVPFFAAFTNENIESIMKLNGGRRRKKGGVISKKRRMRKLDGTKKRNKIKKFTKKRRK